MPAIETLPIYDVQKDPNLLTHIDPELPVVFYHHPCIDGIGAAYLVWQNYQGRCLMHAWSYGQDLPHTGNRDLIFVDICPTFQQLCQALDSAGTITIIDHHMDRCTSVMDDWDTACAEADANELNSRRDDVTFIVNKDMSGTMLAWFAYSRNPDEMPMWVEWTSDGDLWRFKHEDTHYFRAYCKTIPLTLRSWDAMVNLPDSLLISMGRLADAAMDMRVEAAAKTAHVERTFNGVTWALCNAEGSIASELGAYLCSANGADVDVAIIYQVDEKEQTFKLSIRSTDQSAVSALAVAKQLGGGGHKNAAGVPSIPAMHAHRRIQNTMNEFFIGEQANAPE